MSRVPLTLIGESINDSVPSTHALFEANDLAAITGLARSQSELGADYIDVNVGPRPADFMAAVVRAVQAVTPKPLSIDSPDYALAAAGLAACDPACGTPILNSISPLRLEMFDLLQSHRFRPILLASENLIDGDEAPCRTAEETYDAARLLLETARSHGLSNDDCIIDPGIAPIGADTENNIHRLMGALRLIHDDPAFAGVHMSVGLQQLHRHAAVTARRRVAGQVAACQRLSHACHAARARHDHRFRQAGLRRVARRPPRAPML